MNIEQWDLWPTRVMVFSFDTGPFQELKNFVLTLAAGVQDAEELRVHSLENHGAVEVKWLMAAVELAVHTYIGGGAAALPPLYIALRGVVIKPGGHISSHSERNESDIMVAFWPDGDVASKPHNSNADPALAPTFVLEDPSRHLSDLRLPFESRHSINVCPKAGTMLVGPAHLVHNMWPNKSSNPFVHIVAQVKVTWPQSYKERW